MHGNDREDRKEGTPHITLLNRAAYVRRPYTLEHMYMSMYMYMHINMYVCVIVCVCVVLCVHVLFV